MGSFGGSEAAARRWPNPAPACVRAGVAAAGAMAGRRGRARKCAAVSKLPDAEPGDRRTIKAATLRPKASAPIMRAATTTACREKPEKPNERRGAEASLAMCGLLH